MATAITPLANITLSSSVSTITLSSISQSYKDLMLVFTYSGGTNAGIIRINSDSGSNYSYVYMAGNGSTTLSGASASTTRINGLNDSDDSIANSVFHFMDYSATDKHKTALSRHNSNSTSNPITEAWAHRWANTSAITTIEISGITAWVSGSSVALYGVSA